MKHFSLILLAPLLLFLIGWSEGGLTIDVDSEEAQYLEEKDDTLYYKDSLFTGELVKYYDNGKLSFRKSYKNGVKHGKWVEYYENGELKYKGTYKHGEKNGFWKEYAESGQLLVAPERDELAKTQPVEKVKNEEDELSPPPTDLGTGKSVVQNSSLTPYTMVGQMPEPPDGLRSFYLYIYRNINYPRSARKKEIQGTVYVQFVVAPDGSITNIRVLEGPGGGLNEEAVRVIKSYPKKWKPGKKDGKAVPVYFNLPIKFTLQ